MGRYIKFCILTAIVFSLPHVCYAQTWTTLSPQQVVTYGQPTSPILVAGYSVPAMADWNNDGLNDLIVGEGATFDNKAKIRVYLNSGTANAPFFTNYSYAQSNGRDLAVIPSSCLGCFPRVVQWDADGKKDLIVGLSSAAMGGNIMLFLNTGTDANPTFGTGQLLQVGPAGSKVAINVGIRATPVVCDWNNDERKDLVVGNFDGNVQIFINEGTDTEPDFLTNIYAQDNGGNLWVNTYRASPDVADLNGDGKKDLLIGDTTGKLRVYTNVGTDAAPTFSGYYMVEAGGAVIDLPSISPSGSARARPFICDWTGDGYLDVLVGQNPGNVILFEGIPFEADTETDGDVDIEDFAVLAQWWRRTDCAANNDCLGADIDGSGAVAANDIMWLASQWLWGVAQQ